MHCSYFSISFMWRRPLNSAVLATTTHRNPKKLSDGTGTQVRAQMINKCRIKMVQRELYNVRDPPWEKDQKLIREHCSNQNYICNWFVWQNTSSDSEFIQLYSPCSFLITFKSILAVVKLIRAKFFDPLSTNLLYWAYWVKIPYILGLGCKTCLYNWRRLWEELVW